MEKGNESIDIKVINNIKSLVIDMVNDSSFEHLSTLGAAPVIYRLYNKHLNFDVNNSDFINRDRFVISSERDFMLLYATLFMSGFPINLCDLKNFARDGFINSFYDYNTFGVNVCNSYGQGFATGVGLAIGEAFLNVKFKYLKQSLIDHYTYVFVSDCDLIEGISYEAAAMASNLKLGKLIVLYDSSNGILDTKGKCILGYDVLKRFDSLGWDTHFVSDSYDFSFFDQCIEKAKQVTDKPSIIEIKTIFGKGFRNKVPNILHSNSLKKEDITSFKKRLGIRDVEYTVLSDAYNYMKGTIEERCNVYKDKYKKISDRLKKKLSSDLVLDINKLNNNDNRIDIKRMVSSLKINSFDSGCEMSSKVLNKIDDGLFLVCCGFSFVSDDLKYFSYRNRKGKIISCGSGLLSSLICNGLSLMGLRCVVSAFLSFSNYMISSIRVSSLKGLNSIYIFTYDILENDFSYQYAEYIDMLRLIPNVILFRPCDKNEVIGVYKYALMSRKTCIIVVSNNRGKSIRGTSVKIANGAYVVRESINDSICILASGNELLLALGVSEILEKHMIKSRVVSMPSVSLFDELEKSEQEKILPSDMRKVVIEFSSCESYYKFLNKDDLVFNAFKFQKNERDIVNDFSCIVSVITKEILNYFK